MGTANHSLGGTDNSPGFATPLSFGHEGRAQCGWLRKSSARANPTPCHPSCSIASRQESIPTHHPTNFCPPHYHGEGGQFFPQERSLLCRP